MKKKNITHFSLIVSIVVGAVFSWSITFIPIAEATTSGQTTFYLHNEVADANTTYNVMTQTLSNIATTSTTARSTTNVNATPPTVLCEASTNTGDSFGEIRLRLNTNLDHRCAGSFISPPVGQSITINTTDTSSLAARIFVSVDNTTVSITPHVYFYRYSGGTLTLIGTFNGTDPATTSITQQDLTATPSANVTLAAGDRFVAILTMVINSGASGGRDGFFYFDETAQESYVRVNYTTITANKPSLAGSNDDDFTTAATCTTNCTYNTKWTYVQSLTGSSLNAHTDSSQWLRLENNQGASLGTNWSTTPSNTYMYQTVPAGDFDMWTAASHEMSDAGVSPWNHASIFLWTSNTDYLEVESFYNGTTRGVQVNNSGTMVGSVTAISTYNLIWLRINKSGTSYQAQYSTDGSSFTNLGSAITHATAFTRMGLNTYSSQANVQHGATFEFFKVSVTSVSPSVDIVDSGGATVASPSVSFSAQTFSFSASTTTGTLGISSEKVRISSGTAASWTLSIAATSGPTTLWDAGGGKTYDFNDTGPTDTGVDTDTKGGRLTVNPAVSTITALGICNNTGLTKGPSTPFLEGTTNSITVISASGAGTSCQWDVTGVALSQDIPASQVSGTYTLGMTLTIV